MLKIKNAAEKLKLNKTTFPEVRAKNWLNHTQTNIALSSLVNSTTIEEHKIDNACEFEELVRDKCVVYSRINNRKCNKVNKDEPGFYCSLFINRKEQFKTKKIPIY